MCALVTGVQSVALPISGVVDGAAALLITSKDYADRHGLKPRGRIVAYANIGDDPTLMLNAPVPAAKKVLEKAGLTKDDIDVWEINEAFSVVAERSEEQTSELKQLMRISYAVCCLKKKKNK